MHKLLLLGILGCLVALLTPLSVSTEADQKWEFCLIVLLQPLTVTQTELNNADLNLLLIGKLAYIGSFFSYVHHQGLEILQLGHKCNFLWKNEKRLAAFSSGPLLQLANISFTKISFFTSETTSAATPSDSNFKHNLFVNKV